MALRERADAFMAPEPDGRAAVSKTAEAGSTPAPSAAARVGGSGHASDGVRGVTGAREPVELEATGSTPAGHPHRNPGGDDDGVKRIGYTFRGVLLGEQRASKTRGQGSNPCAPAFADVAEW